MHRARLLHPAEGHELMRRPIAIGVAILVVLAGVGIYLTSRSSSSTMHVSAEFPRTISIYPGSSVRILGVPVGKVTKLTPHGTSVTVQFTFSGKYKVPADVTAAIVPPAIVGDRYVQLTPAYTTGPSLANGATIEHTEVPVELDQIFSSLDNLNRALGPRGANATGALSRLIATGSRELGNGNGARLHRALHDVSELIATLDDSKGDLVGVIGHLGSFTTTLANDDGNVRKVNGDLATVAAQLAGERSDLDAAVRNLSVALGQVAGFVKGNRSALKANISGLADVTGTLVHEKRALTEFLDVAPLALTNLQNAFDPVSNSLGTRGGFNVQQQPGKELVPALCSALGTLNPAVDKQCQSLLSKLPLGAPSATNAKSLNDLLAVHK
jgi:phospholipid/cholesterol/gamma-HCH transport system substrate-binding protein